MPARANLITDPGFESCTGPGFGAPPPGWTPSSTNAFCSDNFNTGVWSADFVTGPTTLSQTITTIAGDNYDFSFWVQSNAGTPDFFTASFGSNEVFDLVNVVLGPFVQEDFSLTATGTSTTIEFQQRPMRAIGPSTMFRSRTWAPQPPSQPASSSSPAAYWQSPGASATGHATIEQHAKRLLDFDLSLPARSQRDSSASQPDYGPGLRKLRGH